MQWKNSSVILKDRRFELREVTVSAGERAPEAPTATGNGSDGSLSVSAIPMSARGICATVGLAEIMFVGGAFDVHTGSAVMPIWQKWGLGIARSPHPGWSVTPIPPLGLNKFIAHPNPKQETKMHIHLPKETETKVWCAFVF
jgi:hypothetical protein